MRGIITAKQYEIYYHDIDYNRNALITSLVNFFGDVATYQSEELGIGMDYLKSNNAAWVLYKWDIDIVRFPKYGEKVIVKTSAYSLKKFYAFREHEVCDENGNIIGTAKSVWFLIDIEKRKPIRILKSLYKAYNIDEKCNEELSIDKIKNLTKVDNEESFTIRYSDIDTNRHVNNAKYISWAIEAVPLEKVLKYTLKRIKVVYKKETTYGHSIISQVQIDDNGDTMDCIHKILDDEGKEVTLLETFWISNQEN
ncbi:acyl-ACP thioesterase [Clostridium algidicarnis]|uniref:acyl-[acyl-carrier-protein] thioesterase n=1 Tax=Clostridium algidicarnis TaxID=37659 RepID=UPI001C0BA865|nr:acyl-ACP thioesterase domain-containing protein [Clostridium algidicarnis]MBU3207518.1 acyl-ACP thioesterase [Clostridium algidicarnis]